MKSITEKKGVLLKNTIYLYILVFSGYFFGFVTIPFQTRILGPEYYGKIGLALGIMTYFKLVLEFGFILSATENVAQNKSNTNELSKIVSAINLIKGVLFFISLLVVLLICNLFSLLTSDIKLYLLTFFSVAVGAFLPDFLYRGLESMKVITIRTVVTQMLFVVLVFTFVHSKSDYYLIPTFNLIANIISIVATYIHTYKVLNVRIVKVEFYYIRNTFVKSSKFFISRIASTLYSTSNIVVLGFIYPIGSNIFGLYNSADKLINTAKSCFSPIADSLYPYMVLNQDFKLIKKILLITMPFSIIICFFVGLYSFEIVIFIFGNEFIEAGNYLRILIIVVAIIPMTYLLGFPVLTPMGLSTIANKSIVIGSIFHISAIFTLLALHKLNIYSLCYTTVITEFIVLSYRVYYIFKNRDRLSN